MDIEKLNEVVEMLQQIGEDQSVPKNVRMKVKNAMNALGENNDHNIAVKINKSLQELDELNDNANISTYTRTMIWNVVSSLESIK